MKAVVLDQVDIEASENALSALEGFTFKAFHVELEHDDVEIISSVRHDRTLIALGHAEHRVRRLLTLGDVVVLVAYDDVVFAF